MKKRNAIEKFIWINKSHFNKLIKSTSYAGAYGTRYTKWNYNFQTDEFTFNKFKQIDKHEWSKESVVGRIPAIALLSGKIYPNNPIWLDFKKAIKEVQDDKKI